MVDHILEPSRPVRRLEVITGVGGRRRWSADEKARIQEEATAPGAVVSKVARRNGMSPQHLFTWRPRLGERLTIIRWTLLRLLPPLTRRSPPRQPAGSLRPVSPRIS
jgi:hypothetical protein